MAAQDPDEAPAGKEDPRLTSLEARLKALEAAEANRTAQPDVPFGARGRGTAQGNKVLSVMLGYPLGGGVIGWGIDQFAGTRPWVMLVLLFLGFAAGCREIFRISKEPPK
jgi:ATP synthase protein I